MSAADPIIYLMYAIYVGVMIYVIRVLCITQNWCGNTPPPSRPRVVHRRPFRNRVIRVHQSHTQHSGIPTDDLPDFNIWSTDNLPDFNLPDFNTWSTDDPPNESGGNPFSERADTCCDDTYNDTCNDACNDTYNDTCNDTYNDTSYDTYNDTCNDTSYGDD